MIVVKFVFLLIAALVSLPLAVIMAVSILIAKAIIDIVACPVILMHNAKKCVGGKVSNRKTGPSE